MVCAVVSAAPMLEGYIPNGELLSGAVAATGLAVAVVGVTRPASRRWMFGAGLLWPHRDLLVLSWRAAASFAFLLGGGYWRHYWLLLAAPISTLAGAAISHVSRVAPVVLLAVTGPVLAASISVFAGDPHTITARAASDQQAVVDERRGLVHHASTRGRHAVRPVWRISRLCRRRRRSTGPLPVVPRGGHRTHATERLLDYLEGTRPTYIARYASASTCDPSGRVGKILQRQYHDQTTVDGVTILTRS
jgi:hypothetical protein